MDKRRERRQIAHDMEFVVHIHESPDDPKLAGTSITCEITDFSGHGLHVLTDIALTPDTLLNIKSSIGDPVSSYGLRGEIRWTEIVENHCHMGIQFSEEKGTDLDAWVADFGSM